MILAYWFEQASPLPAWADMLLLTVILLGALLIIEPVLVEWENFWYRRRRTKNNKTVPQWARRNGRKA